MADKTDSAPHVLGIGTSASLVSEDSRKALERIENALELTDTDTLGRIGANNRVVWTASGSWSGSQHVTIGDIRAIAALARAQVGQ